MGLTVVGAYNFFILGRTLYGEVPFFGIISKDMNLNAPACARIESLACTQLGAKIFQSALFHRWGSAVVYGPRTLGQLHPVCAFGSKPVIE